MNDDTMMRQAAETAYYYFCDAVCNVDNKFWKGYSKEHPEIVCAMIKTAAEDYKTVKIAGVLERILQALLKT